MEPIIHKPLAHELLGELALRFACCKTLGVTVGIEIAAGIRSMDFIHEHHLTLIGAKLIFGIHKNQPVLLSDLLTAGKECQRIFLQQFVLFLRH